MTPVTVWGNCRPDGHGFDAWGSEGVGGWGWEWGRCLCRAFRAESVVQEQYALGGKGREFRLHASIGGFQTWGDLFQSTLRNVAQPGGNWARPEGP